MTSCLMDPSIDSSSILPQKKAKLDQPSHSRSATTKCLVSFNPDWLKDPEFKHFIERCTGNKHHARCRLCQKTFSIGTGGIRDIRSHATSTRHNSLEEEITKSKKMTQFLHCSLDREVKKAQMMMANLIAQRNLPG